MSHTHPNSHHYLVEKSQKCVCRWCLLLEGLWRALCKRIVHLDEISGEDVLQKLLHVVVLLFVQTVDRNGTMTCVLAVDTVHHEGKEPLHAPLCHYYYFEVDHYHQTPHCLSYFHSRLKSVLALHVSHLRQKVSQAPLESNTFQSAAINLKLIFDGLWQTALHSAHSQPPRYHTCDHLMASFYLFFLFYHCDE